MRKAKHKHFRKITNARLTARHNRMSIKKFHRKLFNELVIWLVIESIDWQNTHHRRVNVLIDVSTPHMQLRIHHHALRCCCCCVFHSFFYSHFHFHAPHHTTATTVQWTNNPNECGIISLLEILDTVVLYNTISPSSRWEQYSLQLGTSYRLSLAWVSAWQTRTSMHWHSDVYTAKKIL